MIDVLGALMGIDLQASTRPEGSTDIPEGVEVPPLSRGASSPPPPKHTQPAPAPAAEDVEMEDNDEEAQAKKAAEAAKEAGGAAYKNKDFDEAIRQYDLAWNTWPKNLTYLTNLGGIGLTSSSRILVLIRTSEAAYFEKGDYDKCIEVCEKAIEEGRSVSSPCQPFFSALFF